MFHSIPPIIRYPNTCPCFSFFNDLHTHTHTHIFRQQPLVLAYNDFGFFLILLLHDTTFEHIFIHVANRPSQIKLGYCSCIIIINIKAVNLHMEKSCFFLYILPLLILQQLSSLWSLYDWVIIYLIICSCHAHILLQFYLL